jgi:hypothetical protein
VGSAGPGGGGGPAAAGAAPITAPATGQRLTDHEYLNVTSDLFGVDVTTDTLSLPLDPKVDGFRNAASALLPSDVRIEGYSNLAASVVGKVDWSKQLAQAGMAACADFSPACEAAFFATIGRRLFRRPLNAEQLGRFTPIFNAVQQGGDTFVMATSLVASAMLQSPEFLYRLETAGSQIDDFEMATRLSFLLWNSTPDDALLDAAAQSQLATSAGRNAQVARMLTDPRVQRALRDYVDDWLGAGDLLRTSRDTSLFPLFTGPLAADMREEVQRLFARVVWQDDVDLLSVFTSDRTMITPALAMLYGLPAPATPGFSEVSLAQVPARLGLLTQAGILTVTSVGAVGSSIVDRGAFLARTILCRSIPDPPIGVPDLPPPQKGLSERDRLAMHAQNPVCGGCHNQIDPLGTAFETYDAIGALQTADQLGNKLTGAGAVTLAGKNVPYSSTRDFINALSTDPEVGSCAVHKMVQYAYARPMIAADEPMIAALTADFEKGGRHYKAFLTELAEGDWTRMGGAPQ